MIQVQVSSVKGSKGSKVVKWKKGSFGRMRRKIPRAERECIKKVPRTERECMKKVPRIEWECTKKAWRMYQE